MTAVTAYLLHGDVMPAGQLAKLLHQIEIGFGTAVTSATLSTSVQDGDDVLRICDYRDLTVSFKSLQTGNDRLQFHAVIGGVIRAASDFFGTAVAVQDCRITTRSRITEAGTIRIQSNLKHKETSVCVVIGVDKRERAGYKHNACNQPFLAPLTTEGRLVLDN
jgi:hypothetical protein